MCQSIFLSAALRLVLFFLDSCMSVGDDGLQNVGAGLAPLKNLASLSLNFRIRPSKPLPLLFIIRPSLGTHSLFWAQQR